jgi:hypothetical protein
MSNAHREWIANFIANYKDDPLPVGPLDDPTYYRYFVIPRNEDFNVYLHQFRHSDDETPHDHRSDNISIPLVNGYFEERFVRMPVEGEPLPAKVRHYQPEGSSLFRRAEKPHRVVLVQKGGKDIECWSLFIKFPHRRDWGFWCERDLAAFWRQHEEFVRAIDPLRIGYGQRGKGCE